MKIMKQRKLLFWPISNRHITYQAYWPHLLGYFDHQARKIMTDKKLFRILIADDNPNSRKGLGALLSSFRRIKTSQMQIEIVGEAENGQQAVELARELAPDLIFMDINMPQLDGLQATQIIKREQQNTNIVVLSMHSDQQEAAYKSGADEFIAKGSDALIIKQVVLRFFTKHLQENRS